MRTIPKADTSRPASGNGSTSADRVWVGDSPTGRGVFAGRGIRAGQTILQFRGNVIDFPATLRKGTREADALQIAAGVYLDLDFPGRYVNHSCDPNAGVRGGVRLIALRNIRPGEEIRFDYSTTMDEDHWTLECRCGTPVCRGIVRDFKWLPTPRKVALIRKDVVPPFLVVREIEQGRLSISRGRVVGAGGDAVCDDH